MTDPFRPAPARAPSLRFPRERLLRAGLGDGAVDTLAERFAGMGTPERRDLVRFVEQHSDGAIGERFGDGLDADETPTREQLDDLHVPQLRDRLAARHLPVSGVKGELIDRLLASYQPAAQQTDEPEGAQVTALTGDAEQPQQPAPAGGAVPAPEPAEQPAPTPAPEPAPAPAEPAPAAPEPAAEPAPPATLPATGPGAPAAPAEPAAAPAEPAPEATPAPAPEQAPVASPTDTGGTADPAPAPAPTPADGTAGGPTDTGGTTA